MKRLNKMPQPIQTHSAFANKGLIDEEHTGEALYEQEWVGIFWGIFFWISDRNVQVRLKLTEVR